MTRAGAQTAASPRPRAVLNRVDPEAPTHRERLLEALADAIREGDFRTTTVADVVRRARTSRRTFYENFPDRETCFLELFDAMNEVLSEKIAAALDPDAPWHVQVDQAVGTYVDEVAAEPELTFACTREIEALGEAGVRRQRAETEKFADLLVALVAVVAERTPGLTVMSKPTAVLITAGLRELVPYGLEHGTPNADLKDTAGDVIKAMIDPARRSWPHD